MIHECWNRLRLNVRAVRLALSGNWLRPVDVATSYDSVAATYDRQWLVYLRATTERLHQRLPANIPEGAIFELGCGSGGSTEKLQAQYPDTPMIAVDISPGMIEQSKAKIPDSAACLEFHCGDMLDFLRHRRDDEAGLIFSGWAIGYSHPDKVIGEASRVLRPGATLAVVVNRFETMPAVFEAFRRTMRRFPESLNKAVWPRFPKSGKSLLASLAKKRFRVDFCEEDATPITPPTENRLPWLLGTGVLAGFDTVLPLRQPGNVRDFFAAELDRTQTGWEHRYVMFTATKN